MPGALNRFGQAAEKALDVVRYLLLLEPAVPDQVGKKDGNGLPPGVR